MKVEDSLLLLKIVACLRAWNSDVVPIHVENLQLELLDRLQKLQNASHCSIGLDNPLAGLLEPF